MKKLFTKPLLLLFAILAIASFLRLYRLSVNPPSLFGDEMDVGFHAYSVLKTGRDYYGNFLPLHFHSLAEWRTPFYLYSAVPTVAIWGISPLGVRLPAAIFGVLGVLILYLLIKKIGVAIFPGKQEGVALISALLMAVSPWHLQYSRAGFEVTEMLFFFLLGLWLFFKSLENSKWLWLSAVSFILMPWIYSTAKLFTPLLLLFLFLLFRKEIFKYKRVDLIKTAVIGLILGLPLIYTTIFGGGAQRFNYISVFADPTTEASVGASRELAARIRGETGAGISPKLIDRVVYNKFTYWGEKIIQNYISAFSTNFLFVRGDPNPRQSTGFGQFYRIEIIALILGLIFFFSSKFEDKKIKAFVTFLLIAGAFPASLTVDGGNHATRLIFLLPVFVFVISFGWVKLLEFFKGNVKILAGAAILFAYVASIFLYLLDYHTAYPWRSERWWHYGWGEAIKEIKSIDSNYDRVFISMSGEPAWIFFAGGYEYPPKNWQNNFPIGNDVEVPGFGKISHIGKFYFGSPDADVQIYGLNRVIDSRTLYLANAKEVGANLILEPDRVPVDLKLLKIIPFPSGEPAFYIFTKSQ